MRQSDGLGGTPEWQESRGHREDELADAGLTCLALQAVEDGEPMEIQDIVELRGVLPRLRATSKKHLLQELAGRAAELTELHERTIFDALLERERLGSTGSGKGIAIPHARLPGLKRLVGVFARLEQPVEFDAVDGRPVDLVFMLLAPASAGADHLKALSNISRLLRKDEVVERLRGSDRAEAIFALLIEPPARSAA